MTNTRRIQPKGVESPRMPAGTSTFKRGKKQRGTLRLQRAEREIFLSYSHKDRALARRIKRKLSSLGWSAFLAHEDIRVSEVWRNKILEHLESCSALMVVVTRNATNSPWVNQEIGIVMGKGKPIAPLVFGRHTNLVSFLEMLQCEYASRTAISKEDVRSALRTIEVQVATRGGQGRFLTKTANYQLLAQEMAYANLHAICGDIMDHVPRSEDRVALTNEILRDYGVSVKSSDREEMNGGVLRGVLRCDNSNCVSNSREPVETKLQLIQREPVILQCYFCDSIMELEDVEKQLDGLTESQRLRLWRNGLPLPWVRVSDPVLRKMDRTIIEMAHLIEQSTAKAWQSVLRRSVPGVATHDLEWQSLLSFCRTVQEQYAQLKKRIRISKHERSR